MSTSLAMAALFLLSATSSESPGEDRASGRDLVLQLGSFETRVARDEAEQELWRRMLAQDVKRRIADANAAESQAWSRVDSREAWEQFAKTRLAALRRSLGDFPPPPQSVRVQVTGTVSGAGYRIENLVFESRPGVAVTANLYGPAEPRSAMPGILICHSHHNPKWQDELQDMGILWARLGCQVLVIDQLGHGERRQHPFRTASDYAGSFRAGRQDYYFRYNVGMQLHTVGDSLIGWMAWDMMRGVDLLLARPGIDAKRIILLGSVAGGGDPAAVTAALDERISGAVPFNFGGPQPETVYPLPANAETSFNYAGGGSWESTRNLRLSARDGFAPWVIVGSIAPRKLIYAHEFAWDQARDPVWRRLQTIFGWHGAKDHLSEVHGGGSVRGQAPESTHCNNIGAVHRRGIYSSFQRWFAIPAPLAENTQRHRTDELLCHTSAAANEIPLRPLHQLAAEIGAKRSLDARQRLAKLPLDARRQQLRTAWQSLLGNVEPRMAARPKSVSDASLGPGEKPTGTAMAATRLVLDVEDGMVVPCLLLVPRSEAPRPVFVGVCQHGKAEFLRQRADPIGQLLRAGIAVCLVDVRGTGETRPAGDSRDRNGASTSISSSELMLAQTLLGSRIRDLRSVVQYLRTRRDVDPQRIGLWGESLAAVNPPDDNLAVPQDADRQPRLAEPMGALAAMFAALFDDGIRAVAARGGLVSYLSLLESPFCYVPHDVIVPSALTAGDLCDVAAALAPRPLLLDSPVNGQNQRVRLDPSPRPFLVVSQSYREADSAARLTLGLERNDGPALADWLKSALTSP